MSYFKLFSSQFNQIIIVALITLVSLIAYFFEPLFFDTFVYKRSLIANGELWRLLTGHFFHTNEYHLLLNLGGLYLLWGIHGRFYTKANYSLLWLFVSLFIGLGLYLCSPELEQYVGLSGVLHGVFVWGSLLDIKAKDKTGYLLFIGVWLKILHEQIYGASEDIVSLIDANVAIDAHLLGAVGGLVFAMCSFINHYCCEKQSE